MNIGGNLNERSNTAVIVDIGLESDDPDWLRVTISDAGTDADLVEVVISAPDEIREFFREMELLIAQRARG